MDIMMPVMDGCLAAKKIKEINPEIPIIGITAFHDIYNHEKYFNDCLQKPVYKDELLNLIDKNIKEMCAEMFKREDRLIESEKEALRVLNGVAEILELTDQLNKSESDKILTKLTEIKKIVSGMTNLDTDGNPE